MLIPYVVFGLLQQEPLRRYIKRYRLPLVEDMLINLQKQIVVFEIYLCIVSYVLIHQRRHYIEQSMQPARAQELLIVRKSLTFQDQDQSQGKVLQVNEFVLLISLDLVEQ